MKHILHNITDWVSSKRGMTITLIIWLLLAIGLSGGPKLNDYKVTNFQSLPANAKAIIAEQKIEQYFPNGQGTPGIFVFHNEQGAIDLEEAKQILQAIESEKIEGLASIVDISQLPEAMLASFVSADQSTIIVPFELQSGLGNSDYAKINDHIFTVGKEKADQLTNTKFYITGAAGIAGDTSKLFGQADFKLLVATIIIILVLLIVIYRSPLLAIIPLLATAIVYQIVNQTLALLAAAGLEISSSTTSIMSILLFAAVIDYSLFVFSRYREELSHYASKHEAMKQAMRATGEPVFFAGGTVLAAMLILFVASYRDYQNFAPVFSIAVVFIMLASITLVPALFTLFGRKAFWPKAPKLGEQAEVKHRFWGAVAKFVVNKPRLAGGAVALFLVVTALNVFNFQFEFDAVKKFPKDLPSRVGYEIVESRYNQGELAPVTLLIVHEQQQAISEQQTQDVIAHITSYEHIASARLSGQTEAGDALKLRIALDVSPYSAEAIDALTKLAEQSDTMLKQSGITQADAYYSGVTAKLIDEREVNSSDIIKIVALETLLIFILLYALTRRLRMSLYMIATIVISYLSALGLGLFLVDTLFGFDALGTRVPIYAFIFLAALGIDYNIMLVSRFLEERKALPLKQALQQAIRNTGGVISSAGVILAATFAALMTMPIADLFVFGFMVAVGILIDTFLVRGLLLPSLILFFEKDKAGN